MSFIVVYVLAIGIHVIEYDNNSISIKLLLIFCQRDLFFEWLESDSDARVKNHYHAHDLGYFYFPSHLCALYQHWELKLIMVFQVTKSTLVANKRPNVDTESNLINNDYCCHGCNNHWNIKWNSFFWSCLFMDCHKNCFIIHRKTLSTAFKMS